MSRFMLSAFALLLLPALASASEAITFTSAPTSLDPSEFHTVSGSVTWAGTDATPVSVRGGIQLYNVGGIG